MKPLVIAHRGANRVAIENSLPALRRAAELGADRAEIDVRMTIDGVPVLMHDATVNRTTDGMGRVDQLTWHQVRKLRLKPRRGREAADDKKVPTLADALAVCAEVGLPLCVELKSRGHSPELVRKTVALLTKAALLDSNWIWSFDWHDLEAVRAITPNLRRGTLSLKWPGADGLRHSEMLVPFAAHQLLVRKRPPETEGRPLIIWTVNQPWMVRRFVARGVDGLITDTPDRVRALLATVPEAET